MWLQMLEHACPSEKERKCFEWMGFSSSLRYKVEMSNAFHSSGANCSQAAQGGWDRSKKALSWWL